MNSSELLQDIMRPDKRGMRKAVPVLGSGVNIQAARVAGRKEDNWSGLLARIAEAMSIPAASLENFPVSNLAKWESMLRLWARKRGIEPFQAERELQTFACTHLKECEKAGADSVLYRGLIDARFLDIISLNFDRRLALSSGRAKFKVAPKQCPEGAQGEPLYRHDLVAHSSRLQTRIWYPHGDTAKAATLKLGVRRYGFHLVLLEESRFRFGNTWRVKKSAEEAYATSPAYDNKILKWTKCFLTRDLVFIGCGLSSDEWALWWMIRSRVTSIRRSTVSAPRIYFVGVNLSTVDSALKQDFDSHGIIPVDFASHDEMWRAICRATS